MRLRIAIFQQSPAAAVAAGAAREASGRRRRNTHLATNVNNVGLGYLLTFRLLVI